MIKTNKQVKLEAITAYRDAHAGKIVDELVRFASLPNNVYSVTDIQANAQALKTMLEQRGVQVELWMTPSGRPLVFGDLPVPDADMTILFYSHYDGVPVEPDTWHSDPYHPVLRTHLPAESEDWSTIPFPADGQYEGAWRIFGRSIADSKNAIVGILAALDALQASGEAPAVHLKFLLDGEEEEESPGLAACIQAHQQQLSADLMISASGETHQSGLPTIELGMRGIITLDITAYTASLDLHSGHFGNFAPSAPFRLMHLLTSMKSATGSIMIDGFYDEVVPLSSTEREAIQRIPRMEAYLQTKFGLHQHDNADKLLQELINLPTLNVRGLRSGYVGASARNIIPHTAAASLDIRLVKGMTPDHTIQAIKSHIEAQGWTILDHEPTAQELRTHAQVVRLEVKASFPAVRTLMDAPVAQYAVQSMQAAVGEAIVIMPTSGGSLPLYLFEQLGIPFICIPPSNFDCNQHTSDENLQLSYFFRSIDIFASLMMGQ